MELRERAEKLFRMVLEMAPDEPLEKRDDTDVKIIMSAIADAVLEEREACAMVADQFERHLVHNGGSGDEVIVARDIRDDIRARGDR